jgi:hypothetical protein
VVTTSSGDQIAPTKTIYDSDEYTMLLEIFSKLRGKPVESLVFLDEALSQRQNIPDMTKTTSAELREMCPFVTQWKKDNCHPQYHSPPRRWIVQGLIQGRVIK